MSFALYLVGFLIFLAGVAWGLTLLGVPQTYVIVAALIILGIGIFTGVSKTRMKDPPQE
jgi:hypothetical protein